MFSSSIKNSHVKIASGVVDPQQLQRLFLLHFANDLWYNTELNWGYYTFCQRRGAYGSRTPYPDPANSADSAGKNKQAYLKVTFTYLVNEDTGVAELKETVGVNSITNGKVIRDGKLYIIKDGKQYSVAGQIVK